MNALNTDTPAPERRGAPRRQPTVNTICRFDTTNGAPYAVALVWNISTTGISVLVPEPRADVTVLSGFLDTVDGDNIRPIRLEVVHCKKLDTGDFALGAKFEKPLTDDELRPFVADA